MDEIPTAAKNLEISELNNTSIENEEKGAIKVPRKNANEIVKFDMQVKDNVIENNTSIENELEGEN